MQDAGSGLVTSLEVEFNPKGDPKQTKWKLTWLAQVPSRWHTDPIHLRQGPTRAAAFALREASRKGTMAARGAQHRGAAQPRFARCAITAAAHTAGSLSAV